MLPFCGYNMGDYFGHWLSIGEDADADKLPKLFWVNWFRKGDDGSFLWPGYGENSRVLEWIFRRCADAAEAVDTPIGRVPAPGALNVDGLDVSDDALAQLLEVDEKLVRKELPAQHQHLARFGDKLPQELDDQLEALHERLGVGHTRLT